MTKLGPEEPGGRPWDEIPLVEVPKGRARPRAKPAIRPVWSEQKAALIARYLFLFVQVTRHGTYIDGFAGPQHPDKLQTWSARAVLQSRDHEPWLRHLHLFEIDRRKLDLLRALEAEHPERVRIYPVDFNRGVLDLLSPETIPSSEAVFCLLDQQTFECAWKTVEALAGYEKRYKIELFYFLACGWMQRAFAATKDESRIRAWWGRDDVESFQRSPDIERAMELCDRFRRELDYMYAEPFAIHGRQHAKGRVMYYMIHASDHPDAVGLMGRAYREVVDPHEPGEQLEIF